MRHTLLLLLCCSALAVHAQPPTVEWSRTAGGFSQFIPYRSVADAVGGIYTAGGGSTLDYGSGITVADEGYAIARYNAAGDILWARALASPPFQTETITGIAVNSACDLWVVGNFTSSTLALDAITLTNTGASSAFIARVDSNGVVQFAKAWAGIVVTNTSVADVCTDGSDNVYVTGTTDATSLTVNSVTMPNSAGGEQLYAMKLDASGTAVWGQMSACAFPGANGLCIAVDAASQAYMAGRFDVTLTIDGQSMSTAALDNVGLVKFTAIGDVAWMHEVAVVDPLDLTVDPSGNSYLCGDFQYQADFDGDVLTPSVLDGFVSAYTSTGAYRWVVGVQGDIDNELCWSAALDGTFAHLLVGGTFVISASFGGIVVQTGLSNTDGFIMHMDTSGVVNWVKDMTGDGPTLFAQCGVDEGDHLYASGVTQSTMSYLGEPVVNGTGNHAFLARFEELPTAVTSTQHNADFQLYPNPNEGDFFVRVPANTRAITIEDAVGRVQEIAAVGPVDQQKLHIGTPGLYLISVVTATGRSVQKVVVK